MNSKVASTSSTFSWLAVGAAAGGLIAYAGVSAAHGVGSSSHVNAQDWLYNLLLTGSALAVLLRAWLVPKHRLGWAVLGFGLFLWAVGDLDYTVNVVSSPSGASSTVIDILFLGFYVAALTGVRVLGGRLKHEPLVSAGLIVCLLGLATLWSLLAYNGLLNVSSETRATLAYPLLDLVLVCSVVLAMAMSRWRVDGSLFFLLCGFSLILVMDTVYAAQTARGEYLPSLFDLVWPAGALLVAIGAWRPLAPPKQRRGITRADILVFVLTSTAILVGSSVLISSHYWRVDDITANLASATLVAGVAQLVLLYRGRARAQDRADTAEELRAASASVAPDAVISFDARGSTVEWKGSAPAMFGYSAEEAVGRELLELIVPPEMQDDYRLALGHLVRTGESPLLDRKVESVGMRRNGEQFPTEISVTRTREHPPVYTGFVRDVSELRRRERENEHLAAIVRSTQDAIVSADTEGRLTAWNSGAESLYGYTADETLGRKLDDLIIPQGHEEEVAEIMRRASSGETVALETKRRRKDGVLVDVSLRAFQMRDGDGNVTGFSTSVHDITDRRRREERERANFDGKLWRGRIEDALANNGFTFLGQPIVDARTGALHHHELLIRMDLDGELLTPSYFLPHAEHTDLISEIDRWAVREGIGYAEWTPVAINLSAKSLGNRRITEAIGEAFAGSSADPADVTFEITETAASQNIDGARELVSQLRQIGADVAIDDFGTGFASFTYLRHLSPSELKIDMEFIRDLKENIADQNVVASMVSMAERFAMRSVAEGIEDEETLEIVRRLGVDLAQGYHLGRPAPLG